LCLLSKEPRISYKIYSDPAPSKSVRSYVSSFSLVKSRTCIFQRKSTNL
jgi:hypothetical protein